MIIGGCRGPGWQVFDADPRLGSQIRNWISSAISGHDCPVDAADAAVVVSELFGNAVMHGPAGGQGAGRLLLVAGGRAAGRVRWRRPWHAAAGAGRRARRRRAGFAGRRRARGPVGQLPPGRCPGCVVVFRAAAARRAQRRLGLAAPGLVRVRPVRARPPGGRREAEHAGSGRGTMSARLSGAGSGLHLGRHLPVGTSCVTAPSSASPDLCPAGCGREPASPSCTPVCSWSLSSAETSERWMSDEVRESRRRAKRERG